MSIIVRCKCRKRLQATDDLAGKHVKCPVCGADVAIPRRQKRVTPPDAEQEDEPVPQRSHLHWGLYAGLSVIAASQGAASQVRGSGDILYSLGNRQQRNRERPAHNIPIPHLHLRRAR